HTVSNLEPRDGAVLVLDGVRHSDFAEKVGGAVNGDFCPRATSIIEDARNHASEAGAPCVYPHNRVGLGDHVGNRMLALPAELSLPCVWYGVGECSRRKKGARYSAVGLPSYLPAMLPSLVSK